MYFYYNDLRAWFLLAPYLRQGWADVRLSAGQEKWQVEEEWSGRSARFQ